jgi:hypothetical protein
MQFPDSDLSGEFDDPEVLKGRKKSTANNVVRM